MSTDKLDCPSTRISLLMRIRRVDNQDAWKVFVATYSPLVLRACRRWGLQEADAQDVTQTVFGIVMRNMESFEYDRSKGRFRGWLGTVTYREIRRHRQKQARLGGLLVGTGTPGEFAIADFEAEWMDHFNAQIYQCAMERIQPRFGAETWAAFELTWLRDQTPAHAAAQLGKPVAWISRAKYRVLQRLRDEIEFLAADVAVLAGLRRGEG